LLNKARLSTFVLTIIMSEPMKRESQPVIVIIDDSENDDDAKPPSRPRKQQRTSASSPLPPPPPAAPMKLFCTLSDEAERRAHTDKNHWSRTQCWTLREMLGYDNDNDNNFSSNSTSPARHIEWLVVGNYLIDFDYLLDEIPELLSIPNVVVFYGQADTSEQPWKSACAGAEFVRLNPSDPPGISNPTGQRIPYGVHHSKFFLVGYSDSTIRVIVHTANLTYTDIHVKAQAAYIQDFPLKQEQEKNDNDDSDDLSTTFGNPTTSDFEETLVAYLGTYRYHKPHAWTIPTTGGTATTASSTATTTERLTDLIRRYDFSTASVVLLPSTPGYHRLDAAQPIGHRKLRQAVIQHTTKEGAEKKRPIICQFSSIGSLTDKYLHELQASMDTGLARETKQSVSDAPMRLQLVYPTIAEIRLSIEGYRGGGSVPGTTKNVSKPFLQSLYRKWSSSSLSASSATATATPNPLWKSQNVPHIKTYYQLNHEGCSMDWFVVTSHNMSKAAWGEVQNSSRHGSRRLFVRHWELGVFLSPQTLRAERLVPWSEQGPFRPGDVTVPQPYSLYPRPYQASDRPWAVDVRYGEPDNFGRNSVQDR
jgi:tyrosyl-DNA phosphodiesterase-1